MTELDLLDVDQVSAITGLTPKTLYNQRAQGRMPGALGFVPFGRSIRWRRATLEAYLAEQESEQLGALAR